MEGSELSREKVNLFWENKFLLSNTVQELLTPERKLLPKSRNRSWRHRIQEANKKTGRVKSQETHSGSRFLARGWPGQKKRVSVGMIGRAVSQRPRGSLSDEAFPLMICKWPGRICARCLSYNLSVAQPLTLSGSAALSWNLSCFQTIMTALPYLEK